MRASGECHSITQRQEMTKLHNYCAVVSLELREGIQALFLVQQRLLSKGCIEEPGIL